MRRARTDCAGAPPVAAPSLSEPPSPYFALDTAGLRISYIAFERAFPGALVCYALKANPDPAVIATLATLGCSFEAASWGEIDLLLSLGIEPARIVYGTAVKPRAHAERAARAGIDRFAADSAEELAMLADAAPGARVFIRVKLGGTRSVFQMNGKFGATVEAASDLIERAAALGLAPWGLSFNVGSQATRAQEWADGVRAVIPVLDRLLARGICLQVLNLGGGFPAAYRDAPEIPLDEIARQVRSAVGELPYRPQLVIEPGRGLVAAAVSLVSSVVARVERPDGPWLFLDCGVYNALYEALLHQGRTAYPVSALGPRKAEAPLRFFTLAGPTGDGLDVIARDVALPSDLAVGDRLLFQNAGAYTTAMASAFNGFPVPPLRVREG